MKEYFYKVKSYVFSHKVVSVIILLAVLLLGYWIYGKITTTSGETRYVTALVTKGTIISSVSGSGQVSASNQVDIKPNVSGTIISINTAPGNYVTAGKTLFVIDNTNAQKAVRDAEINLENANIALQKFKIQNSDANLNANLAKSYDDGFNTVSNTFLDLPGIMTGLDNMFFKSTISSGTGQWNIDWYVGQVASEDKDKALSYKKDFTDSYDTALQAYNVSLDGYKQVSRTSDDTTIEKLISQTYNTTKLISDAIKNANNYIDFINDSMQRNNYNIPTIITTHKTSLSDYTSKTNTDLLNLLSIQTSIKGYKDAFPNSNLDSQSTELSVKQKQNALLDAQQALADYYVKAPFDGVIASIPVIKGSNASSGTALGTIITSKSVATISLNEVDVAKIALGQKATLTFDAIPDLTISGKVIQIDSLGTVSQGVVNYSVKISFDTNDIRIKPGMSVSAEIITNVKQDVLTVPNNAIKKQGTTSYVQMFDTPLPDPIVGTQGSPSLVAPVNQTVETGISDNTSTEIISGLKESDQIVTKIITVTASTTSTTPSLLNAVGGNTRGGAGGNAVRALGR